MRSVLALSVLSSFLGYCAFAQENPAAPPPRVVRRPQPPAAGGPPAKPLGKRERFEYVLRQVPNLKPEQLRTAEGILDEQLGGAAAAGGSQLDLDAVRQLFAELQPLNAIPEKDRTPEQRAQIAQLTTQLQELGKRGQAGGPQTDEGDLTQSLRSVLDEKQAKTFDRAMKRLMSNPSGLIRPVDVLDAARDLNLTTDQQAKLDKVEVDFRVTATQVTTLDEKNRENLINTIKTMVKGVLTPEQSAQLDHNLGRMSPMLETAGPPVGGAPATPAKPAQPGTKP